jgi:hypothetical protein
VLSTHASNDTVTVAAFTGYSKGTLNTVTATTATVTRPATAGHYKIVSVTMASNGSVATVDGTTSATAFSETRDASGGPPYIPVESVEIGQVRLSSSTSGALSDEIYQDIGTHAEYTDYPLPEEFNIGKGSYSDAAAEKNAHIKFSEALPTSHTGGVTKSVYTKYYTPTLTTLSKVTDFVGSEVGVSKSSETMYEGSGVSGAIGSMKADSIGDASFTLFAGDGLSDSIIREKNDVVTVKFFPDANKAPYLLTQGMLGIDREFPSDAQNKIACTIYCEKESVEFTS